MSDTRDTVAGVPAAALAGIIATVAVFAISQGLSYPLLSFLLHKQGIEPAMIGLSAAMTPLGFVASSFVIPTISRMVGPARFAVVSALIAAALLVVIGLFQNIWLWFPLRFLLGFFANPLYVISETWMVAVTPSEKRGRILGVYTSMISVGFAAGPLTLAVVGTDGWPPFAVGVITLLLCVLCLLAALPRLPAIPVEEGHGSVLSFIRLAPLMLGAVFVAAAFEQIVLSLFSIYGAAQGSSEARVALLLAMFVAGNIAFQIPLGWMAERFGAVTMMGLCAFGGALGCLLLPFIFDSPLVWPMTFAWGAAAFSVYTMALILLGERFSGAMLIIGNSAFAVFWGTGGIIGPPVAGLMMDVMGIQGLPLTLGILCGGLALAVLLSTRTACAPA